jgi:hypothetical protein
LELILTAHEGNETVVKENNEVLKENKLKNTLIMKN